MLKATNCLILVFYTYLRLLYNHLEKPELCYIISSIGLLFFFYIYELSQRITFQKLLDKHESLESFKNLLDQTIPQQVCILKINPDKNPEQVGHLEVQFLNKISKSTFNIKDQSQFIQVMKQMKVPLKTNVLENSPSKSRLSLYEYLSNST